MQGGAHLLTALLSVLQTLTFPAATRVPCPQPPFAVTAPASSPTCMASAFPLLLSPRSGSPPAPLWTVSPQASDRDPAAAQNVPSTPSSQPLPISLCSFCEPRRQAQRGANGLCSFRSRNLSSFWKASRPRAFALAALPLPCREAPFIGLPVPSLSDVRTFSTSPRPSATPGHPSPVTSRAPV